MQTADGPDAVALGVDYLRGVVRRAMDCHEGKKGGRLNTLVVLDCRSPLEFHMLTLVGAQNVYNRFRAQSFWSDTKENFKGRSGILIFFCEEEKYAQIM